VKSELKPKKKPATATAKAKAAAKLLPHFVYEQSHIGEDLWPVAGVDEAGRGPLAGPVAVAAVILNPSDLPDGVDDSKALSAEQREPLFDLILSKALCVSLALACADEIDQHNIRMATLRAMARAVAALHTRPRMVLVDGRDVPPGLVCDARAIVGGDATCMSIAAASIVAKVARDRLMARLDSHCPGYGFARHVGYATRSHIEAIATLGPSPFHRRTFGSVRAEDIAVD
jgi:ribonuclease HII